MNRQLLDERIQHFLRAHLKENPQDLALLKSPFSGVSSSELATQLDGLQRSRLKLPDWFATEGIYYPKRLSLEQSSSALTAAYKASLVPEGSRVLDMTGGFGVDSFTFARDRGCYVTYCERDEELATLVQHNAEVMGIEKMDFHVGDGVQRLREAQSGEFDLLYLDPARRKGSQKVYRLEDTEPAVPELLPLLFKVSQQVMLKLSPMLDLQEAIRALPAVRSMHIISVNGECKELLAVLHKKKKADLSPEIVVVSIKNTGPTEDPNTQTLSFTWEDEQNSIAPEGHPRSYLYEPDAALLKAGAFKWISQHFKLTKLHKSTHLYTSDALIPAFMGRITQVEQVHTYASFKKSKQHRAGNVITRNFPLKPAELRKRHHIKEDANTFFHFCKGHDEQLIVIQSARLTF